LATDVVNTEIANAALFLASGMWPLLESGTITNNDTQTTRAM